MVTAELGACEWFVYELRRSNLIDRGQLDQIVGEFLKHHPKSDAQLLAEHLVSHGVLTPFQAERVLTNKSQGLVLGPYVLTDALGAGSMGTVYRAVSKTDSKEYAVKVLPRRSMWNVRLARRQVRAFGQFSHPAVVPFVDVGTSGGTHYLVWPLVGGESLEKLVTRLGRLTAEQTAQIGGQVATALAACHGKSLIHGLLKPSNIMVGPDVQVAILDFGIGSLLAENEGESLVDTMSTSNTLTSGLDCASPESIMEPTNRTPAGDQYSLGCVLYYCLAGRYPFADGSAVEKMVAHQMKQPTPIQELAADVPAELVATIGRLMQKKPDERFGGADEAAERLLPLAGPVRRDSQEGMRDEGGGVRAEQFHPSTLIPHPSSLPRRPSFSALRCDRPSSLVLPAVGSPTTPATSQSKAGMPALTSTPSPRRSSAHLLPMAEPAANLNRSSNPLVEREFVMPPGYVPEPTRAVQYGPLAVAVIGIGAMILSYLTFMTISPFK
jgi:serine/threonine protein kinase